MLGRRIEVRLVLAECFVVLLEAALELGFPQDRPDLFADSNEFSFAQAVDLTRRQTSGGVKTDIVCIHRSTVRNRPDPGMSARIRQGFFFYKVEGLDVSWNNVVQYRIVYIRGYSMGFRSGYFSVHLLDLLVEVRLLAGLYDLGLYLGEHSLLCMLTCAHIF